MAPYLPITFTGENLGQRHRVINLQVLQAAKNMVSFQDIDNLSEQTPVDRLFKIDLANKLRHVEYILTTLKDDDMLYVSRALKSKWLVERQDYINPKYLEDVLFPEMVMPAISKMKNWLYINLRNPMMCQQFYTHYKDKKFDFAVKFLSHCNEEFLNNEFPKILVKITPHYLKVLGEKYPKLVKTYYDSLATNGELVKRYLKEKGSFYNNIKCVLKSDPHIFLDITERYYNLDSSIKLGRAATDYMMRFHKNRFMAKPELYIVYLLHLPTVARNLSDEECQEVVMKLARADYISSWFSYANVEPLVKRVRRDKRAAFKKLVFVEKTVGDHVSDWPYVQPSSPVSECAIYDGVHVFYDYEYKPIQMREHYLGLSTRCCKSGVAMMPMMACCADFCPPKSELQKLFDEFRFVGFEGTLHELRKRVWAAKSAYRRRDMLLVLVSKSGGRADAVREVLQLALKLRNEPVHERAAVVRSLVKRASAWRLPQDVWDAILEYGHGLGLDGSKTEAECREGLHAVVLRQLLATGDCEPGVRTVFLKDFSTLAEYKLSSSERLTIADSLQRLLAIAAASTEPKEAANRINQLLDVLDKYHISYKSSQAVSTVAALADRDAEAARFLLVRLYDASVGRRELFHHCLMFRHDDASLLNALRHEPTVITPDWIVKLLVNGETKGNMYCLKLAIYFNEANGIAKITSQSLRENILKEHGVKLARPLATLAGSEIQSIWSSQGIKGDKYKKLAAALRANMHRARPAPDAVALGWPEAGMKAVAWRVMRCRPAHATRIAQTLLDGRVKRGVRLALVLAQRTNIAVELFSRAVNIRPIATLRAAILYFRSLGDAADLKVWDIVKPLISRVDLIRCEGLRHTLRKLEWIPTSIKPDYCALLYLTLDKISDHYAEDVLLDLMKCLPEVSDDLFQSVILRTLEKMNSDNIRSFPAIFVRYLMLSKSNDEQKEKISKVMEPFLNTIYTYHDGNHEMQYFYKNNFDQLMGSLLYNAAFFYVKYQYCLPVIERVKVWMETFLPKDMYFKHYVAIHVTMLYYKAVRQSLKQKPEVFEDPVRKITEGVEIVGQTFGRYVVKELAELRLKYFDSIVELYQKAFVRYLNEHIVHGSQRENFVAAVMKGILSEGLCGEARLTLSVLENWYYLQDSTRDEILDLMIKSDDKEMHFFTHAYML